MLDYYKGMDVSSLKEMMDAPFSFKNKAGEAVDPFQLMVDNGVNSIRLRIWNEPENVPESRGYCNLNDTILLAQKAKEHGLHILLNFHYSDYWADPGKQNKPAAWKDLSFEDLVQAVYNFTYQTLAAMREAGVTPQMVQVGNEVRSGLLFPDGEVPNYKQMVQLLNAGLRAVKEFDPAIFTMIHLDQGGRYSWLHTWFEAAFAEGLDDFDIIGLSYYPFWHGSFAELKHSLSQLVQDYNKEIILAEVAHAWRIVENGFIDTAQERIAGFPANPLGQRQVLDLLNQIVSSLPDKKGRGIYYWEPLMPADHGFGGWADNMTLVDNHAQVMEGIEAFLFERNQYKPDAIAKIYWPKAIERFQNNDLLLPKEIDVLYNSGDIKKHEVVVESKTPETVQLRLDGLEGGFSLPLVDTRKISNQENLFHNPNFDERFTYWNYDKDDSMYIHLEPDFIDPFPAPPENILNIETKKNSHFMVEQVVSLVNRGSYRFSLEITGADTTGVDIYMFAKSEFGEEKLQIHPTSNWEVCELQVDVNSALTMQFGIVIHTPINHIQIRRIHLNKIES